MSKLQAVKTYYDRIAADYDASRFSGSYGRYLHRQEISILKNWLGKSPPHDVLELGCGTGRFGQLAHTGVDFSAEMLAIAKCEFPENNYRQADIRETGLPAGKFQSIICLHVLMHLEKETFPTIWKEAARLLAPGGHFIFDIPSAERRQLLHKKQTGWHGGTSLSAAEVGSLNKGLFQLKKTSGVLHFPVHQLPENLRNAFRPIDSFFGKTILNRWASYRFYKLRKS